MQVAVDDTDVKQTETNNSPSNASTTTVVRGFSIDTGATYADFQASNVLVRGY